MLDVLETKVLDDVALQVKFRNSIVALDNSIRSTYDFYVIIDSSMIYVADVDFAGIDELIDAEKFDDYKAFDMTDEDAYYWHTECEMFIREAIDIALIKYIRKIK